MKISISNIKGLNANGALKSKKTSLNLIKSLKFRSLFLAAFVIMFSMPISTTAKPPLFKLKKTKIVKVSKRNAFDIEFGTFNYESPIVNKKSIFIG